MGSKKKQAPGKKFRLEADVRINGALIGQDDVNGYSEADVADAIGGVDMEQAMAAEVAQRLMVPDEDVTVTIHDVLMGVKR